VSCVACDNPKKATDKRTSIFSNYLEEEFNLTIQQKKHYYVTVPKNGCQGAIESALNDLNQFVEPTENITFLIANKNAASKYLTKNWKIFLDRKDMLGILNLPISNVSIIETEDEKIKLIKSSSECNFMVVDEFIKMLKDTL